MHKENMQTLKDTLEIDALEGGRPYEPILPHMDLYIESLEVLKETFDVLVRVYGFKEAMLSIMMLNNGTYYVQGGNFFYGKQKQ